MPSGHVRDRLEPRDWSRPWRDPPGFLLPACNCCTTGSTPCTNVCSTAGTAGTDTGGLCTDCSTQVIIDHFTSLNAAWIGSPGPCGPEGVSALGAHVTGGVMDMGVGGATILRPFTRPAIAGLCIQVRAKIVAKTTNSTGGLTLAYGRQFFGRPTTSDYGIQSCIDVNGCVTAGTFTTVGTLAVGDIISFIFKDDGSGDTGGGAGSCTVCYLINGATVRVETGVKTCFPSTMYAGLAAFAGTGTWQFDDFEVRTS